MGRVEGADENGFRFVRTHQKKAPLQHPIKDAKPS
jgi:hypothetical protein